jgi:DNA-binding PadR family transcriptional regulator
MPEGDPLHATLVAVLKQLNQAETRHEGDAPEQALELGEVEERLADFWAVRSGAARVSQALGLLLKNGMVRATQGAEYSWQRQREVRIRYQITAAGKQFLLDALENSDRVG